MAKKKTDGGTEAANPQPVEYTRFFDNSPIPTAALEGDDHVLVYANPAFCELIGKTSEELTGEKFTGAVKIKNACRLVIDRVYNDGESGFYVEPKPIPPRKVHRTYFVWAMADPGKRPVGVMVQINDVSPAPTAAHDMTAMNEQLLLGAIRQHEVSEADSVTNALLRKEILDRAETQSHLLEELEPLRGARRASAAKSTFLASMSHELRTPLTTIIGYAEVIQEDIRDKKYDDVADDLAKISSSSAHLLVLIANILDIVKIEAGKMDLYLAVFDAVEMVDWIATQGKALARMNANTFVVRIGKGVKAVNSDETKIRQVLLNLVGNAAKFTSNGTITLDAEVEDDMIFFRISDTGIGISQEDTEGVFESFYQVRQPKDMKSIPGTGLGLSLCKQYTELLGGGIQLKSELGKGTEITVKFPIDYEAARKDRTSANKKSPA